MSPSAVNAGLIFGVVGDEGLICALAEGAVAGLDVGLGAGFATAVVTGLLAGFGACVLTGFG